jgi:CRISPR-associated protein Cas5t
MGENSMNDLSLQVSVPVCSFRKPFAREYRETEMVPPPATVYGFLLSLIGEEDRLVYAGTRLAIAVLGYPNVSTVLRKVWRVNNTKYPPGIGTNARPDYQELLTGVELAIWVAAGELEERLRIAANHPGRINRFGGLSLGESRDLVDEIHYSPEFSGMKGLWLFCDERGRHPLPVWVDHVGSRGTVWQQFSLNEAPLEILNDRDHRWITIRPPE